MAFKNVNVLVVDDQALDRQVLARHLVKASAQYNCTLAEDADEAIELLEEETYDICVTDYHLGNTSALEFIHNIKAMGIHMPILVVTGVNNDEIGIEVIKAGADDFFPKEELSPGLLSRTVQHILIRYKAKQELEKEAAEDWLTATASRRHFEKVAAIEMQRAHERKLPVTILLFDMDNLKTINDEYGHEAGDLVLKKVAGQLQQSLRQTDLLCRWGGDEFCALLDGADQHTAQALAEKLCQTVAGLETKFNGETLRTTLSIGVASYPNHRLIDVSELFRAADRAVYKAKSDGRNCVRNALMIA